MKNDVTNHNFECTYMIINDPFSEEKTIDYNLCHRNVVACLKIMFSAKFLLLVTKTIKWCLLYQLVKTRITSV